MNAFENYAHFNLWHKFENSFGCAYNALGDAGKSIYTDFLTFQIIPHLDQSVHILISPWGGGFILHA